MTNDDLTKTTETDEQDGEMNRRTFIQTVGAAGAVGAAGVSVSGSAAGKVAVPDTTVSFDTVTFDPLNATSRFGLIYGTPLGTGLLSNVINLFGSSSSDASAGDISFHNTALSAFDGWENAYTLIKNYLEDLPTTMNVRARSAVADAYDSGKTQSEAQQAVADSVYARADTAARNAIVSKMTLAIQLANISATATNTSEVLDIWENTFFGVSSSSYSGTGTQVPAETGIVETEVTESITLPSGDTTEVQSVKFEIGFDNGDGATYTISDLLSNYKPNGSGPYGEFSVTTNNGNTITDDFTGTVPSLPSASLASRRCINMAQLGDIYDEISTKASTVIGNYGSTFVGDIYNALDNGTITTGQLRGVEGLASLLSGSTDATESRYQLALSTLYDIPRPDLSEASYMEVELDGWTDESIRVDTNGNRSRILENRTKKPIPYRGQLFAKNVSTDLKAGETYLFDVPIISAAGSSVKLLDSSDGSVIWENSTVHSSEVVEVAPFGPDSVVTGSAGGSVAVLDLSDGSVIWENSSIYASIGSVAPVGSDSVVAGSSDGSVALLNSSSGSVIWENPDVHPNLIQAASSPFGSDSLVIGGNDGSVLLLDLSDGSVIWENSTVHSYIASAAAVGSDGVVAGSGSSDTSVALLNRSDGSVIWENSSVHSDDIDAVAPLGSGSDSVLTASADNSVALLNRSDGSVIWQNSTVHSNNVTDVAPFGPDRVVTGSNDTSVALLNRSDGSVIWQNSDTNNFQSVAPVVSYQNHVPEDHDGQNYVETYDGYISNGFFGGVNLSTDSDDFEEVPIRGTMKILSMQDSDGNSVDQINTDPSDPDTTYGPPEYEQLNNTELANRLDTIEKQLADALDEAGNEQTNVGLPSIDGPGNFLDDLPSLPGFSTVESLVIVLGGGWLLGQLSN